MGILLPNEIYKFEVESALTKKISDIIFDFNFKTSKGTYLTRNNLGHLSEKKQ